ncbi:MAG: TonB family protein [Bdellovibrionota bacterium]
MALFVPLVAGTYITGLIGKKAVELFEVELLPTPTTNLETMPEETPQIQQRKVQPVTSKPVEQVFGVDKTSLRSNDSDSIVLKEGNTIAKEVDQKKLLDDTPLPVPKPQYLVSQMPVLKFKPEIPYPSEAKKREIEGKVMLNILIDENGKVRKAELLDGPGFGLNEIALQKINEFIFQPAKIGDQYVPVQIRYAVTFQLRQ